MSIRCCLLPLFLCAASAFAQSLTVWTQGPSGDVRPPSFRLSTLDVGKTITFYYKATTGQPVNASVTFVRPASGPTWLTPTSANNLPAAGSFKVTLTGPIPNNSTSQDNGHYLALVVFRSGTRTEQGVIIVERFPNTTLQADTQELTLDAQTLPSTKITISATIVAEVRPLNINCSAFLQQNSWLTVNPPSFGSTPNMDPTKAITSTEFEIKLAPQAQLLSGGLHASWVGFRNLDKPSDIIYVEVNVNVKALPPVDLSGTIHDQLNQPLAGVTLTFSDVGSVVTNATGRYAAQVPAGYSGTATPSLTGYSFTPPSRTYSNLTVAATAHDYTGSRPPSTVTISGAVQNLQGQPLTGVSLVGTVTALTDASGNYVIQAPSGFTGTVTPTFSNYTFSPQGRAYSNLTTNVSGDNYTGILVSVTISGTVATQQGQAVSGVAVSFGGGQTVITDSSGGYTGRVSGNYAGTVTPSRSGYSFDPPNRSFANVVSDQGGANFTANPQAINGPVITQILNAAGFQPTIQQQSWVTIKGTSLGSTTGIWSASDFVGGKLPTRLNGVSVSINGKAAAVYYTSPTQINVCAPPDTATGTVSVTVTNNGATSSPFSAQMQFFSPAFFQLGNPAGNRYAIATDGATILGPPDLVPNTVPARPGQVVSLWGTGFGPVDPAPPSDAAVPLSPLFLIRTVPAIRVGGRSVEYLSGVLAGGSVGLYLINVRLPADLPDGDQKIEINVNGTSGPDGVFLFIRR